MSAHERLSREEEASPLHIANIDVISLPGGENITGSAYLNLARTPTVFSIGCIIYPFDLAVYVMPAGETDNGVLAPLAFSRLTPVADALDEVKRLCDEWEQEYPNGGVARNIAWYSLSVGGDVFLLVRSSTEGDGRARSCKN
ncbi:hypothetical protein A3B50_01750 [Candidatus Roizmanbacteria bacterium RIFCSPLOWO2_01_FULL_40_42]|uniref:Uncharacterized protein n=1 Tax=Candidatus Roizmanbacteria bacterium RIFCSPLOWO2_01_FULL_40_42 TaxID=1802066 RepID=A0A1F7J4G4_9BACT|nr:MAG: hypothetical protein A2779_04070 [Candidatus Roizmanbacteria bacterium RIFCSPHIGHO2_01_FULL_40_98]OGK27254.1 MAG: hypothetical protein A3C31_04395 [Candidatus Roizmanbacteria bacterium RIFCSPHIGHO2_02_FULL_40_53]OGK30874.1 MAG: hypothetical protein A2W49_02645 [Candidatus Roizmanbacteria bacterium RIFCSPHIGHO2_12_41_18]OGK36359.1 MAG: hypothetical protein A3E69_02020 [Candidatus Roizmanbacteria bacterium RIFCSPHIGHO2_12_FULL_40_130]OGK50487.1 MAG: hypothetical protein A3B50_01750 [Candi